jgi:glutamate-1-semialdehyde 2,1-aminomutase
MPMVTAAPVALDRARIRELTEREEARLNGRTRRSGEMYERARRSMVGGVASSYQVRAPWPIYLAEGKGSRVWDVDGTEMVDFHNGFGSMVQGHAHPAIVRAVQERVARGTHFAAPIEDALVVSEELARRFGLPLWRYVNSGPRRRWTRSGSRGRRPGGETIVKIFGSYHGHHDYVMVSIAVPYENIGGRENLASLPYGAGIPKASASRRWRCRSTTRGRWSGGSSGCSRRGGRRPA